ncbi:hypothetical protein KV697_10705 [Sphingomonas sanguinis]|uniref:hypothetical protein n=1 Tax=Sphingomonas sanguinis TaxID=33051 RepID=UPI001C565F04|nr:hypothetical protein [Sphingomonas sanguinis]QXT34304.1 hypothetical protein KV697_10705 [Sphingomonas sanguinis]
MGTANLSAAQRIAAAFNDDLERIFQVHLTAAEALMTPQEITDMLVRIATNVGKAASVSALRHRVDSLSAQQVCDAIEATIAEQVRDARPEVLKASDAITAAQANVR